MLRYNRRNSNPLKWEAIVTRIILGATVVLLTTAPVTAQMMTGYSVNVFSGIVTTFSCDVNGDQDCFRYRTELGTIPVGSISWWEATTLAPTGELVVGNAEESSSGEPWLYWLELPTLDLVRSLPVIGDPEWVGDLAFGPDGTLWLTSSTKLYAIDLDTGQATEVWSHSNSGFLSSIAFVGERMFLIDNMSELLEYNPSTGAARLIKDYWPHGPMVNPMSSFDGQLWSLSFIPTYPPGPPAILNLGVHDLGNGDLDVVVPFFDYATGGEPHPIWTLDLVPEPEQQPSAVPDLGRSGLIVLVLLLGLSGVLVARRVL